MSLKRLESQGLIEKVKFSDKQIISNINRAKKDLITAKANIKIDEEWSYTISYHAMLRAGRALMFSMAEKSLESAERFVKEIMDRIQKANPQKKLF